MAKEPVYTVEIKRASDPAAWYRNQIGKKFRVYLGVYCCRLKIDVDGIEKKEPRRILLSDCRIIEKA